MSYTLHPHQLDALSMLRESLKGGRKRPMLQAVTGFGKTILAASIIEAARARNRRVIFCVPAISLIDQTVEKFARQGISCVGVMQGQHPATDASQPVQVASVQTLRRRNPNLMVTDPPYGVNYDPAWRRKLGADSEIATGRVLNDHRADWREAWALFPGDVAYVWHGALHAPLVADSLAAAGFGVRSQIIWDKTRLVIGRGDYHWQHEPAWYAVRKGGKGHWNGDRKQTTVWAIPHRKSETGHGTQKPVECMRRPIENNSSPGQAVYEPFCGSGTTIIAAEMAGRSCHAIELDPAYVDVAVTRWQQFTGKQAILDGDGRGFAEVAAERQAAKSAAGVGEAGSTHRDAAE